MRSSKATFVYLVEVFTFALWLSGCGGSGSLTSGDGGNNPPSNPTVSTVNETVTPASLQAGDTAQATCTVTMSDGTPNNDGCTFASDNAAIVSVDTASGLVTAKAPGAANITAASIKDTSKTSLPFAVTVAAIPVTITSVTVTTTPNAITTTQTAQVTATVTGTGSFSSAVTWTATGGTISGTGNTVTLTPSGIGTATTTATSTQTGYTTVSGSASVTVTRAAPVLTSATVLGSSWIFCPLSCSKTIVTIVLTGTGFQAGDTVNTSNYWPTISLPSENISANGTQIAFYEQFGASQQPGPINFSVVPTDGTPASGTVTFAYLKGYNSASHGPNGELINSSGNVYLWENTNGTLTNTLSFPGAGLNTVYETDGTNAYFISGFTPYTLTGTMLPDAPYNGWGVSSTSAENGTATVVQPGGNEISLYQPAVNVNPTPNNIPVGTLPYASVMVTINGTTYELVASVDGTPTLWKLDTNGTFVGSTPLTGVTSLSDIYAAEVLVGGWPMAIFHTGTAAGKVAFVSAYDKSLLLFDATNNALPLLKTVPLPCAIPSAVDAIDSTGHLVVSCILTGTSSGATFLDIDPVAGTATPLTSTSPKFPLGFLADANNLYVFYGAGAPDVQPNK